MPDDIPTPELVTIRDVELVATGHWFASTGEVDITRAMLESMLAAQDDATVREPVLKIGHHDPRFDGQPAFGWIKNLRIRDDANGVSVLVGDIASVPKSLAALMVGDDDNPAPLRSRSVEIVNNHMAPSGKEHPHVLRGLALLGVQEPAVETLADIMRTYDIAAAGADPSGASTTTINVVFMGATSETVTPSAPNKSPENPNNVDNIIDNQPDNEPGGDRTVDIAQIRSTLGMPDDATDDAVMARLAEVKETADRVPDLEAKLSSAPKPLPDGVVTIDQSTLDALMADAAQGVEARNEQKKKDRDDLIDGAIAVGKFARARRDHFVGLYDADPEGTREVINNLAAGTVPVEAIGNDGNPDEPTGDDATYASLYGDDNVTPITNAGGK